VLAYFFEALKIHKFLSSTTTHVVCSKLDVFSVADFKRLLASFTFINNNPIAFFLLLLIFFVHRGYILTNKNIMEKILKKRQHFFIKREACNAEIR